MLPGEEGTARSIEVVVAARSGRRRQARRDGRGSKPLALVESRLEERQLTAAAGASQLSGLAILP